MENKVNRSGDENQMGQAVDAEKEVGQGGHNCSRVNDVRTWSPGNTTDEEISLIKYRFNRFN